MGIGLLGWSLVFLAVLFGLSVSQQPNTDDYFVSNFLQNLSPLSSEYDFSSPVCSWEGVVCDSQGHVTQLAFSAFGLSGLIPENSIGKLAMLQSLDLSNNKIAGVSSDFWSLGPSLKSLNLSYNRINSTLPNNLGNFGLLERLDLSCNNYSGSIPQAISSISALQVLNLSGNSFEGEIPAAITNCKSLVSVDLSSNRLIGTIPEGFGAAFTELRELNLAGNKLYGSISEISSLGSLRNLNLSDNAFVGSVKSAFQLSMQILDLSKNQFQGYISQVPFNSSFNWSTMVFLDLSQNQLSGQIFNDLLDQAQSLIHLNLAHNKFFHQNFPRLEKLSSLEYLNLSGTNLQGPISNDISKLANLTTLDLSQNHLTGHIPDLNGPNFIVLDLSFNNLTGEFPFQLLQKLPQMEKYNFSYNNFTLCTTQITPNTFRSTFYGSQEDCPIAANPGHLKNKKSKHRMLKLALALTISIFCLALGFLCFALTCRIKSSLWTVKQVSYKEEPNKSGPFSFQTDSTTWVADVKSATSVPVILFDKPLLNFTFADLLSVTSHFDRGTLLAEGRFGPVYRGFLPGGTHIAVKVLVRGSTMTDQEAAKELEYLGRIKHQNLVPLIGYCLAGEQRIVIYEYMENGNLQNLLHDLPLGVPRTEDWSTDTWEEDGNVGQSRTSMSSEGLTTWAFRHRIALGTARALAFLHHGCFPQIIHREVKASSVYLGPELEPRLSDFGLSKIFGSDLADELTRASPGYTPPELSNDHVIGTATTKSDVYGFGVVLFELITGKKPLGDEYPDERDATLVSWVRGLLRKNQGSRAIDPKIRATGAEEQIVEALRIGYLCTADLPSKRPDMHQIVGLLKDIEPGLDK